ncbi:MULTISPECIES: zinc ribbon domain-containing protein [Clostridia]|uniref:zinc ribbon domain-containing protein n=1 Tax=Clostridia TaxID=186801 RepID=UPI001314FA37|nr:MULTISPECIES: zinc ribbon domain-containing protein [Clostridia]
MKTKAKYLTAILFLASVVMYFVPFMGWERLQLRLFDLVQIGFGNKRTEEISRIVDNLPQSQMSLLGYVILGAMFAALVGAVLSVLLKKDAPYFATVILSVLINIVIVFSVLFMKQKMGQMEQVLKLNKTLGESFEINRNLVYIWIGIFVVNIAVSLLAIALPDKKRKKDTRIIYSEQPVKSIQRQYQDKLQIPVQQQKLENQKHLCPQCGNELPENAKFCTKCGQRL